MRKEKQTKIGDRKIVVRELSVGEIEEMYHTEGGIEALAGFFRGDHEYIPAIAEKCSDLSLDEIREMGVMEYKQLLEALREVNADFFVIWRGELAILREAKQAPPSPE